MPKSAHRALERRANQLQREGRLRDRDAFIFGTLREIERRRKRNRRSSS